MGEKFKVALIKFREDPNLEYRFHHEIRVGVFIKACNLYLENACQFQQGKAFKPAHYKAS